MRTEDKNLIIATIILCLVISVLAPFIASSNPDGLEKSAEQLTGNPDMKPVIQSPMPDYTIEPLGKQGEILAMILGILVTLVLAYIVAILIRRRKPPQASEEKK
jgi:cobalt/nickel transport protein